MTDREKLIDLAHDYFKSVPWYADIADLNPEELIDYLLANGVSLQSKQATSNENKRIEELEAQLAEREKVVIQLRKQWQDAEMHICTMCGHFDHKTDGNMIYGNRTCGEICGYPFCNEKFTPWIPVSERLPGVYKAVIVWTEFHEIGEAQYNGKHFEWIDDEGDYDYAHVTHWMPLPNPPEEVNDD